MTAAFWNGILADHAAANTIADRVTNPVTPKREPCVRCEGLGEWDEGPLPAHSAATEPEYRQVICPVCEGRGWQSAAQAQLEREASGPDTYRDWLISYDPPPIPVRDFDWHAVGPNYDAWTEDGEWRDNGEKVAAPTRYDLICAIDNWFEEHS